MKSHAKAQSRKEKYAPDSYEMSRFVSFFLVNETFSSPSDFMSMRQWVVGSGSAGGGAFGKADMDFWKMMIGVDIWHCSLFVLRYKEDSLGSHDD
jgi:hypothetical protein